MYQNGHMYQKDQNHFNRNQCNEEFYLRAKDFPMCHNRLKSVSRFCRIDHQKTAWFESDCASYIATLLTIDNGLSYPQNFNDSTLFLSCKFAVNFMRAVLHTFQHYSQ